MTQALRMMTANDDKHQRCGLTEYRQFRNGDDDEATPTGHTLELT